MQSYLEERLSIADLMTGWIHRDLGEWDQLRNLFHPDATIEITWFAGKASEFVDGSMKMGASDFKTEHVVTSPVDLGEPQFDPWFEELNRRSATFFVHPTITKAGETLLNGLNASVIEFMFDTTRMITNMVATGAKKRFSQIKIISAHGGGTIPFLVNRIQTLEHTFGVGPGRLELSPEEVREGIASFYYDLTAATSEAQLYAILKLVPVSQLLMGFDFPLMPKSSFAPAIADVGRYSAFSETDLRSISYENAFRLYPELAKRIG